MLISDVSYIHNAPTHIKQNYDHQGASNNTQYQEQSKEFQQHIPVFTLLF
jgi:hypothetical protein